MASPTSPLLAVRPEHGARALPAPGPWAGVVALLCGAAGLGALGARYLLSTGSLGRTVLSGTGEMAGPLLFAFVAAVIACERLWPAQPRPLLAPGHRVDACYLLLFALVVAPAMVVVQVGLSLELHRYAPALVLARIPAVPKAVVALAVLVGVDGLNWCAHLANHRRPSLWRVHSLHHSQEEMGVLTTFRTHPLVHVVYLVALLPAIVLSASGTTPALAVVAYGCLITLPHANLRWTFGPLGRVFVSPMYHRLHHAQRSPTGRDAVNLGFVLVCWDQLARRAVFPTPGHAAETGLAGRPVPVEQAGAALRLRRTVTAQLVQPLRRHTPLDG